MIDQMNIDQELAPKIDGRTKEGRAARAAAMPQRGQVREGSRANQARETNREPDRQQTVVLGRDGKPLSRVKYGGADPYEVPADLVDPEWDRQWIPLSVYGDTTLVQGQHRVMYNNGWRPVMAVGPWQGRMMPPEHTGPIVYETLGLYERPMALTEEARLEEKHKADSQMRDRDQSLMGGRANLSNSLPGGIELKHARAKVGLAPEAAPRPSYSPADDSI